MTDSTSINADVIKGYLFDQMTLQYAATGELVAFGHPGMNLPKNVIAFTDVRGEVDFATFTPGKSRDENVEVDFIVSCYEGGSNVAEKVVSDRAYGYVRAIERFCRVTQPTLNGLALYAFVVRHQSTGTTDPEQLAAGRTIEVIGTVGARVRIRN